MSKELPPSRTADQFVVRFPDGMRDRIAGSAKGNNRSMNAELIARIQQSFEPQVDTSQLLTISKLASDAAKAEMLEKTAWLAAGHLGHYLRDAMRMLAEGARPEPEQLASWQLLLDMIDEKATEAANTGLDAADAWRKASKRHQTLSDAEALGVLGPAAASFFEARIRRAGEDEVVASLPVVSAGDSGSELQFSPVPSASVANPVSRRSQSEAAFKPLGRKRKGA